MNKNFEVSDDFEIWEDGYLQYVTVFKDDMPTWKQVTYDNDGAYIIVDDEKYYVLVDEG